jgi:outer membrane receptor for ferrienterochelin and colicins
MAPLLSRWSLFLSHRTALACTVAGAAVLLAPPSAAAQTTGVITGTVTERSAGTPIVGATVRAATIPGRSDVGAGTSNETGRYRIGNLAPGLYAVTATRLGYEVLRVDTVRVSAGETAMVNFALTEAGVQLNQVVTTASRGVPEKVLDAPASISVVSTERIEERPSVSAADHLQGVAGVQISRGGLLQSNIVARGFNNAFSGSMLMLQDYRFAGVPSLRVNAPGLFTGANEDIERMEVLLGPASALYGPNSANGVLHIITKSPFNSQGTTVTVDGGERSLLRTGIRHAGTTGQKFGYKISGEYMRGRDWEYNDPAEPVTIAANAPFAPAGRRGANNARDFDISRYTGEARMDVRPRDGMEAITTLGYTAIQNGYELTGANGTSRIRNWTYTNLQQRFRWNRLFAQAFVNMSDAGNEDSTGTSGTYLLRSGAPIVDQSRVLGLQAQHGVDLGVRQTFTYGADYIFTNPRTGNTINGRNEDDDNVTEYGAYLQSTTRPTNWLDVLLAARVDRNNVIDGTFFSPRAALTFKPTETQSFRATFNRAFSTPANFAFFLDLPQAFNVGGSGFNIRAVGNPPKRGYTYRAGCAGSALGDLCMRSPLVQGGAYVPVSAASAFPTLVGANAAAFVGALGPSIAAALQANAGLPAAQATALGNGIAQAVVQRLATSTPSNTDIATRVSFLTTPTVPVTPGDLGPVAALEASYNSTWEVGYKGVIGNRFRLDASYWYQKRGDVGTPSFLATPSIFFGNPTTLGGYVGAQAGPVIVQQLVAAGLPAAAAQALAGGIAPALATGIVQRIAPAPLGVVTFDDPKASANTILATYRTLNRPIYVSGVDVATDLVVTNRLTLLGTGSWLSRNVWNDIPGGNGLPYMSNSPRAQFSLGGRWDDARLNYNIETRMRYASSYPVNSAVYATDVAFLIPPGNPGYVAGATGGVGRCNPAPAGTYCYEPVPVSAELDLGFTKRFDIGGRRALWSINVQNLLDRNVRSFPGVAERGRLAMTRLQYVF